jgi:hypothetical protein
MRTVRLLDELAALRERGEDLLRCGLGHGTLEVGGDVDGAVRPIHLYVSVFVDVSTIEIHTRLMYSRTRSSASAYTQPCAPAQTTRVGNLRSP